MGVVAVVYGGSRWRLWGIAMASMGDRDGVYGRSRCRLWEIAASSMGGITAASLGVVGAKARLLSRDRVVILWTKPSNLYILPAATADEGVKRIF